MLRFYLQDIYDFLKKMLITSEELPLFPCPPKEDTQLSSPTEHWTPIKIIWCYSSNFLICFLGNLLKLTYFRWHFEDYDFFIKLSTLFLIKTERHNTPFYTKTCQTSRQGIKIIINTNNWVMILLNCYFGDSIGVIEVMRAKRKRS